MKEVFGFCVSISEQNSNSNSEYLLLVYYYDWLPVIDPLYNLEKKKRKTKKEKEKEKRISSAGI